MCVGVCVLYEYAYIYYRHVSLSLHCHLIDTRIWFYFDLFDTLWFRVEHWPITFWCFLWLSDCRGRFRHKGAGREDHIIRFSVYEEKKQDPNISLYIIIYPNNSKYMCAQKAQNAKAASTNMKAVDHAQVPVCPDHHADQQAAQIQSAWVLLPALQTNTGIISCQANLAWLFQGHKYYPFHLVVSRVL